MLGSQWALALESGLDDNAGNDDGGDGDDGDDDDDSDAATTNCQMQIAVQRV